MLNIKRSFINLVSFFAVLLICFEAQAIYVQRFPSETPVDVQPIDSSSCLDVDSNRYYADLDCDGTKDAGEGYLVENDEAAFTSDIHVTDGVFLGSSDQFYIFGDNDGGMLWQGLGNGNDEGLTWNLDDGTGGANTVEVTSATGVTRLDFTGIKIKTNTGLDVAGTVTTTGGDGVTDSGISCTITDITDGIITGATCA